MNNDQNFPNLVKEKVTQVEEAQRVPNKLDAARLSFKIEGEIRPIPRHIIIKMAKFKDKKRILKAPREMHVVTYKEAPIRHLIFQEKHFRPEGSDMKYSR